MGSSRAYIQLYFWSQFDSFLCLGGPMGPLGPWALGLRTGHPLGSVPGPSLGVRTGPFGPWGTVRASLGARMGPYGSRRVPFWGPKIQEKISKE